MRKALQSVMAVGMILLAIACGNDKTGVCHITGTVDDPALNGRRIFLVPMGDTRREVVDSIEIKDGKFEFTRDTVMMAQILLDYHYRMNTQTLLVVVEPGELQVQIGRVSSAAGTPLNDSLQQWKVATESHNGRIAMMRNNRKELEQKGNKPAADSVKQVIDSLRLDYKNYSRRMAANIDGTVLGDFLKGMFPRTYKRLLPDSTVVEYDADTHEPIR